MNKLGDQSIGLHEECMRITTVYASKTTLTTGENKKPMKKILRRFAENVSEIHS